MAPATAIQRSPKWTRRELNRIRKLYLIDDYSPAEIAEAMDLDVKRLYPMLHRKGWSKIKKKQHEDQLSRDSAEVEAIQQADDDETMEEIAQGASMLASRAIDMGLEAKNAFDLNQTSSALSTNAKTYRLARGLDRAEKMMGQGNIHLTLFVGDKESPPMPINAKVEPEPEVLDI